MKRFNWRARLPVHPAADKFPMMEETELDALAEDIRANALRMSLITWKDPKSGKEFLIDGRNRLEAMARQGMVTADAKGGLCFKADGKIHPLKLIRREGDPYKLVISLNVHRRHLTREKRRDLIAELLRSSPQQSNRAVARDAGTDHKTVATVRGELETSGEIPQSTETTGLDGITRPARRPSPAPQSEPQRSQEETDALIDGIIDQCLADNRYYVTTAMEELYRASATDRYDVLFSKLDKQLQQFRAGARAQQ
jgi:hypothetical protein